MLPESDFPTSPPVLIHTFTLAAADLEASGRSQYWFAISTEETRYYLNGIHFHAVANDELKFRAVATDGHHRSRRDRRSRIGAEDMPGVDRAAQDRGDPEAGRRPGSRVWSRSSCGFKIRLIFAAKADGDPAPVGTLTSKLIDGTFL